jgi:hypothetical protein
MDKTIMTLGDLRLATVNLPDEAVLNVGAEGSYLTWSVADITSSITAFTAPDPETVFVNLAIDIDWQVLAAYAVLRTVEAKAFPACLQEISSRGIAVDWFEQKDMEKLVGEEIAEADWRSFVAHCNAGDVRDWKDFWKTFRERDAHRREVAKALGLSRDSIAEGRETP